MIYDVIIIGAGPAGLTASIYASRYKLSNLVIGKQLGGELSLAHKICNIPGFIDISGLELAEKWKKQVESLGAKVLLKEVEKIEVVLDSLRLTDQKENLAFSATNCDPVPLSGTLSNLLPQRQLFRIYVSDNEIYQAKSLIVGTGSERRRLNVPGEKEYLGRGVSYCTTCDATFFRNKTAVVIGGSDAAVTSAIHLADYCQKVYIIYRGESLRAEQVWLEEWKKIETSGKGEIIYATNVIEIKGDGNKVTAVKLDKPHRDQEMLAADGIFVSIGGVPGTTLVQQLGIKLDESGHVVVNDEMETNLPGLFCAGDMTDKSKILKQAITAMAQGAIAASSIYKYLKNQSAPQIKGI